nr:hypothetical protein Iba_chr02cCG9120 [Ipomoea batatas]
MSKVAARDPTEEAKMSMFTNMHLSQHRRGAGGCVAVVEISTKKIDRGGGVGLGYAPASGDKEIYALAWGGLVHEEEVVKKTMERAEI